MVSKLWRWIVDPLDVTSVLNTMHAKTTKLQAAMTTSTKKTEELTQLFKDFDSRMEEYMFLEQVNKALDSSVPDMFWVKDLEGRYLMANEAIRNNLLCCSNPIGLNDRQLAEAEIARVGADNHTFGAICGNSDVEVIQRGLPTKFNEDGLVKGKYLMLQVHKNVVRNKKGDIIATVGVGRDLTHSVLALQDVIDTTTDMEAKVKLEDLLNHYKFEDRV